LGAAQYRDIARLFGWKSSNIDQAVASLVAGQIITPNQAVEGLSGEWIILNELL
jgi:hypothetical protein